MFFSRNKVLAMVAVFAVLAPPANAQGIFGTLKRTVEREANRKADQAVTEAIQCAVGDRVCENEKERRSAPTQSKSPGGSTQSESSEVSANYDFISGGRILFVEDFATDRVGNFPRRLGFLSGNMDVVETGEIRRLRATSQASFEVRLPQELPDRFTLEFDLLLEGTWLELNVAFAEPESGFQKSGVRASPQYLNGYGHSYVHVREASVAVAGIMNGTRWASNSQTGSIVGKTASVRLMVDGPYAKLYINEQRVANLPEADLGRSSKIAFYIGGETRPEKPLLISNIRVAESDVDFRDALLANGRVSTQGIHFDLGSDAIRPASRPTLQAIAQALKAEPTMRLLIEGHTDNSGQSDANIKLSSDRAAAVVRYLVQREGVAAGRLTSTGLGDTRPVADNSSSEGRQSNRRVEFVVIK